VAAFVRHMSGREFKEPAEWEAWLTQFRPKASVTGSGRPAN
jgi:hypothetical protein